MHIYTDFLCERSIISAGIVLAVAMTGIFVGLVVYRVVLQYCFKMGAAGKKVKYNKFENSARDVIPATYEKVPVTGVVLGDESAEQHNETPQIEMAATQHDLAIESCTSLELGEVGAPSPYMTTLLTEEAAQEIPLPRRNMALHSMSSLHSAHKNPELYDFVEYKDMPLPVDGPIVVPGQHTHLVHEKSHSCWSRSMVVLQNTRIPYFDWTLGNIILVLFYLALNVICLFIAPDNDIARGSGSLAACNMMLLVVPACRNSIIALGLNVSFDRVVWLHRFIGRFCVGCIIVHGAYYINTYNTQKFIFMTGIGALACGIFIGLTSMNFVRRNYFNLFFWSHYIFVVMLILVYIHVKQTHPFIIIAVILYAADKLLRWIWMLWPRTTLLFTARSESVAQVRFPKNPITKLVGFHEVGQYYFVNFPALSLTEWHPFSVSSGPREETVELHIRNLGDHTKRIVELAKQKGEINEPTWICIDGPYGQQNFNYRRQEL